MKKLFKKLSAWIQKIFNALDEESKVAIPIAITITSAVKQFMDSSLGEFSIAALKKTIPGKVDDIILDFIDDNLADIIIKLKLIESANGIEDKDEKVRIIISFLRVCSREEQNTFWQGMANLIYQSLKDGELSWGEVSILLEAAYKGKIDLQQ